MKISKQELERIISEAVKSEIDNRRVDEQPQTQQQQQQQIASTVCMALDAGLSSIWKNPQIDSITKNGVKQEITKLKMTYLQKAGKKMSTIGGGQI